MAQEKPSILDRLCQTVESLAELRVVTVVGEVTIKVTVNHLDNNVKALPADDEQSIPGIFSEVNLVTGDLITLVHEKFQGADDPIAKMHASQVESGRKIVEGNVNTITTLAASVGEKLGELLKRPRSTGETDSQ